MTTEPKRDPRSGIARVKTEFMSLNTRVDLALRRGLVSLGLAAAALIIAMIGLGLELSR